MSPELYELRSLMTAEDRSGYRREQRTAFAALLASVGSFLLLPITLVTAVPLAVLSGVGALVFGLLALRSSKIRDIWEHRMVGTLTERLQDEVFLRYSLIPTRQVILGREDDFVDVDNATVRGVVTLNEGGPVFMSVYAARD